MKVLPMDTLHDALEKACEVYEKQDERLGSALAIKAAAEHFMALGIPLRLVQPLIGEIGRVEGQENRKSTKRIDEALRLAAMAAFMELLKREGLTLVEASKVVAQASGDSVDPKKLREFKKNLSRTKQGRQRKEAVEHYTRTLKLAAEHIASLHDSKARIAALTATAGEIRFGKTG